MKKTFLMSALFVSFLVAGFAQEAASKKPWEEVVTTTETGKISGSASEYSMAIIFTPYLHEVILVYQTSSAVYNDKDAVLAVRERALLFSRENAYDSYSYIVRPETKFDNVNRIATLTARIALTRYTPQEDY
ncbi:MAG: hypothetical protein ACRC5H_08735 [Treponemataceae bacterium]